MKKEDKGTDTQCQKLLKRWYIVCFLLPFAFLLHSGILYSHPGIHKAPESIFTSPSSLSGIGKTSLFTFAYLSFPTNWNNENTPRQSHFRNLCFSGSSDLNGMLRTVYSETLWTDRFYAQNNDGPSELLFFEHQSSRYNEIRQREKSILSFLALGFAVVSFAVIALKLMARKLKNLEAKRQAMNERILQTKKMSSIGQLAVGIAHEINNPIACIKEEAGWMQDILSRENMQNIEEREELLDSLREIHRQAGRCRDITHKLLSFGRKMDSEIRETNINELVDEVSRLWENSAEAASIRFVKSYDSKLPSIFSDPSQLRQVFYNLISNSMDAIQGGNGEIRIRTVKNNNQNISVTIEDTGAGIPAEDQSKVFDPFFTTKETGKGVGLGLSICHGIIEKLEGDISVNSEPGKGSAFTVTLPVKTPAAPS